MKLIQFVMGLVLAMSACLAQAAPVNSMAEGPAGSHVLVMLNDDNPAGLFGATIKVIYDSNILTFINGVAGTIRGAPLDPPVPADPLNLGVSLEGAEPAFVDATDPAAHFFVASLAYPLPFGANAAPGSLMNLMFAISGSATVGTTTDVIFDCDPFGDGACLDYDFSQVKATVTVIERTPIPLPGTLPLLGLGVAALWWTRRRIA